MQSWRLARERSRVASSTFHVLYVSKFYKNCIWAPLSGEGPKEDAGPFIFLYQPKKNALWETTEYEIQGGELIILLQILCFDQDSSLAMDT